MIIKSIKLQLAMITALFFIFVGVVLFQIYYTRSMQQQEMKQLKKSNYIVSKYLKLAAKEREIIERLRGVTDNPNVVIDTTVLPEIDNDIDTWFKGLKRWVKELRLWEKSNNVSIKDVFNSSYVATKKRQMETYKEAVALCKKDKFEDARHLTNIESNFIPSINRSVLSFLSVGRTQLENTQRGSTHFYSVTAFAVVSALVALIFASFKSFSNLRSGLSVLDKGTHNIANAEYSKPITLESPLELAELATSFNKMKVSLKERDEKIKRDHDEIKELNKILEQKVEDRNKTILHRNAALKRKNEELEQILYAASHDLRTPLISIQGFSEELKHSCEELKEEIEKIDGDHERIDELLKEDLEVALNYILNGSLRMEILLEGLLRLSRMGKQSLQIIELNMNELLQSIADSVNFQLNDVNGKLDIEQLEPCNGDRAMLEQVFSNLISNAIKYRHPDRPIEIKIWSNKLENGMQYFVKDNGIGITDEYKERVFQAFFRVDENIAEGDGVGLAIVHRALDLHGGHIWLEKSNETGSIFGIELPNKQEL